VEIQEIKSPPYPKQSTKNQTIKLTTKNVIQILTKMLHKIHERVQRIKERVSGIHHSIKFGLKYHLNKNESLLKHVIFMGIMTTIANLFAVGLNIYAARRLDLGDYGALGSLIAIIFIFSTTFAAVHMTITRFVSHYKVKARFEEINSLLKKSFIFFFFVGLAIFIATLCLSPVIKEFLHLDAEMPIIMLGLILWLIPLCAVMVGGLRGLQKFRWLAASGFADGGFRFVIGVILIGTLSMGVLGGISAIFIATFLSFMIGFIALFTFMTKHEYKIDLKEIWKYGWPVFIALISLGVIANSDIIIVKHFFSARNAGQYTVASIIATLLFFTSNIFSLTMFPKVTDLHSNGKDSSKLLKSNLFYMLIISIITYVLFHFYADSIIKFFFSQKYHVSPIVNTLIPAYSFLALANILVIYDIAIGKTWHIYLLAGFAILQPLIIWFFHPALLAVALIQVCTMTALFYILLISTRRALIFHQ